MNEVINLYSRIDLKTLISGKITIDQTSFILKKNPKTKNEKLILLASKFNNIPSKNLCLSVKYPLGKREKRLELVFINENINILKISKKSLFDKDAMEMDFIGGQHEAISNNTTSDAQACRYYHGWEWALG